MKTNVLYIFFKALFYLLILFCLYKKYQTPKCVHFLTNNMVGLFLHWSNVFSIILDILCVADMILIMERCEFNALNAFLNLEADKPENH